MEVFRDIIGSNGDYMISNLGNIISKKKPKMQYKKPTINIDGYPVIKLYLNGIAKQKKVHVLVAESFLNHNSNNTGFVVDHINGDRANCKLDNLRIVTHRENCSICYRKNNSKKTSKYTGVCWHKNQNKWVSAISINNKIIHLGYFEKEIDAYNAYIKNIPAGACGEMPEPR